MSGLKGKHRHVSKNITRIEKVKVPTWVYRVEKNRKRTTEKGKVYKMYVNHNTVQQGYGYREYSPENVEMYTNTVSTSVQNYQCVCTPDLYCTVGWKERSNVKICVK
jgi:hypothetical protein